MAYIEAENAFTESVLRPTAALRERLYGEMKARFKEEDASVPEKNGDYWYSSRDLPGREYLVHERRKGSPDAAPEIILDENALAAGTSFFALGAFEPSPDQRYLAFGVDDSGDERYTIFVKDLQTGTMLPDRIASTGEGLEWSSDGTSLFYVVGDEETLRPFRIMRHVLGQPGSEDTIVYEEKDPTFTVSIERTKDRVWLLINSSSSTSSELWLIPGDRPETKPLLFAGRRAGLEYDLVHHYGRFFILTNFGARDFRVMVASAPALDRSHDRIRDQASDRAGDRHADPEACSRPDEWREFIPEQPGTRLEAIETFEDFLVVYGLHEANKTIRAHRFSTGRTRTIPFPEPVYGFTRGENLDFAAGRLRLTLVTLTTPDTVYDIDLATGQRERKKRDEVAGGFDRGRYREERLWATASDGARIPISVVYRTDFVRDGTRPMLLYGYGAYGGIEDLAFDSTLFSLLDRGFVYAIAYVRGGEEMGREWYEQGRLLNKINTFTDFIACAEFLIRQRFTSPSRLAIHGLSAGGVLMGAVTNMRPDLFKAVVADVPFVDAVNTMLDPSVPLVTEEYGEWGDPRQKKFYEYIKRYSPYDNIERKAYPAMLVTAGMNDPRVQYWEPVKYVAKMRAMRTDANPLLLKTSMDAGHFSVSGRFAYLREVALRYAFLLQTLGVRP